MTAKDLSSFLPFDAAETSDGLKQPVRWGGPVRSAIAALARGPQASHVASGKALGHAIVDIGFKLGANNGNCERFVQGMSLFFDHLLDGEESRAFFDSTLPRMAELVLRLPKLLTEPATAPPGGGSAPVTVPPHLRLRLLRPQQPGLVLISQELAAALLAGAFFCVYPAAGRPREDLPAINFDTLFAQAGKLRCLVHYFSRVCARIPQGAVSYERKVLPLGGPNQGPPGGSMSVPRIGPGGALPNLPDAAFWSTSQAPLCPFAVTDSGWIEDSGAGCLEVDFANKYLGGGEEIRFVISPELVVGMLFLPAMADNESIEVVGSERFSCYSGYASTFKFAGDYADAAPRDALGRRETRVVAVDALPNAGERQFRPTLFLREVNKAFCGFLDHAAVRGYYSGRDHVPDGDSYRSSDATSASQLPFSPCTPPEPPPGSSSCAQGSSGDRLNIVRDDVAAVAAQVAGGASDMVGVIAMDVDTAGQSAMHSGSSLGLGMTGGGGARGVGSSTAGAAEATGSVRRDAGGLGFEGGEGAQREGGGRAGSADGGEGRGGEGGAPHARQQRQRGVATGNWGCGAFGGDVELKSMLQWLAASQVTLWIQAEGWQVGDLWAALAEYSWQRVEGSARMGFFAWLLPPRPSSRPYSGVAKSAQSLVSAAHKVDERADGMGPG
eukprot:jgi/Mesen1/1164/ME000124S00198